MKKSGQIPIPPRRSVFEEYFYQASIENPPHKKPLAPYISISRDLGCRANEIAQELVKAINLKLNQKPDSQYWDWINKQILIESSRSLNLNPSKVEYVFKSKKKSTMDEVVGAMATRYYKNDKNIRTTITRVVRSIARNGRMIIVGRGGVAFAKDNPRSLHIKLVAPVSWRLEQISRMYKKSLVEAREHVMQVDKERKYLIDSFMGYTTDLSIFDLILNRKTMSKEEIVSIILNLLQSRNLIF